MLLDQSTSARMRAAKGRDNKLDSCMSDMLLRSGIPFNKYPKLFGKPDFLIQPNIVIFCDGSLWHGRDWPLLRKRLSKGNNPDYWVPHISKNRKRDKIVNAHLKRNGYKVIRLWDKDVYKRPEWCLLQIKKELP